MTIPSTTATTAGHGGLHKMVRLGLWITLGVTLLLLGLLAVHGPVDGKGDPGTGHWGEKTATVNWCEPDYAYTPWIAEFGNAVSSFAIVGYGVWGVWSHLRLGVGEVLEWRFPVAYSMFVVVGIGSFLFHATLLRTMQLLDELPMIWTNSVFVYSILQMEQPSFLDPETRPMHSQTRKILLGFGLLSLNILMSLSVIYLDSEDQNVFLLCYGSGLAFIVYRSFALNRKYNSPDLLLPHSHPHSQHIHDPETPFSDPPSLPPSSSSSSSSTAPPTASLPTRKMESAARLRHRLQEVVIIMELSIISYFLGLMVWILDRLYCPAVAHLHLHGFWHFFAAIGTFLAVLFWLWTRMIVRGKPVRVAGMTPLTWRVEIVEKLA